jgi:hypothetical protein
MKQTKNSKVSRDTFPVVRKGISLHASRETLLFQKMKIIESTNRSAEQEAESSWSFEDRFFRPLTPESIARQLREMQTRWYNPDDREFDLEDLYERWLMEGLITAVETGGLTLK